MIHSVLTKQRWNPPKGARKGGVGWLGEGERGMGENVSHWANLALSGSTAPKTLFVNVNHPPQIHSAFRTYFATPRRFLLIDTCNWYHCEPSSWDSSYLLRIEQPGTTSFYSMLLRYLQCVRSSALKSFGREDKRTSWIFKGIVLNNVSAPNVLTELVYDLHLTRWDLALV